MNDHQFCLFNGSKDTHIHTGADYDGINVAQIARMVANPVSVQKDKAPAIIPSTYRSFDARTHDVQRDKGKYHLLCFDFDKGSPTMAQINAGIKAVFGDVASLIYSSRGAKPGELKWRAIVTVKEAILGKDFNLTMRLLNDLLEKQGLQLERTLERPGQPVFLPNRGEYYEQAINKHAHLASVSAVKGFTEAHTALKARIERDRVQAQAEAAKRAAERAQRLSNGDVNPTDWFNDHNDVESVMLQYGYEKLGKDYKSLQSSTGSYAVRVLDQSWVSHSGSDVDSGLGVIKNGYCWGDAFDLYCFYEYSNDAAAAWRALSLQMGREKMHQEFEPIAHCETGADAGFEQIDATAVDVTPKDDEPQPKAPVPYFESAPMDIFSGTIAPRFDVSAMPQPIQNLVTVNHPAMGAPESLMAMAALGACMAAVDKRISIKPQQSTGWREHPVLWLMGVGDPSVKKSPVRSLAFREITNIEKNSASEANKKQRRYDLEMKVFKKREADFIKELNKGDALIDDAPEPPIKPEGMRFTVETTTIEALMRTAANNPAGLVLNSDELSGWFGAMDAYSGGSNGGASKDRALWLHAYNSQATTIDRVGGGQLSVENFAVGACGFVQPDALRGALKNLPVDGLLQRFMPFIGTDAELSQDVPADAMGDFNILVANIRLIPEADTIEVEPSKAARDTINTLWSEKLFPLLQYDGIPSPTRNHIAKLEGALWRITLLFHII